MKPQSRTPTDKIIGSYEPARFDVPHDKRDEILKLLSEDLTNLILHLRRLKPDDRSELSRRFAIATTEAEKLDAYITTYILIPIGNQETVTE